MFINHIIMAMPISNDIESEQLLNKTPKTKSWKRLAVATAMASFILGVLAASAATAVTTSPVFHGSELAEKACPDMADYFDAFDKEKKGYMCVKNSDSQIAKGRGKYVCACCDQKGGGVISMGPQSYFVKECTKEWSLM